MLIDKPLGYIKPIAIKIDGGILINIQRANAHGLEAGSAVIYYSSEEIKKAIDILWQKE